VDKVDFDKLADAHGMSGKSRKACKNVLVHNMRHVDAAREASCTPALVTNALKRLDRETCDCCGQVLR